MHLSFKILLPLALLAAACSAESIGRDPPETGEVIDAADIRKLSAAQKLQRRPKSRGSPAAAGIRDGVDRSLFSEMEDDFNSADSWKKSMRDTDGLPIPHVVYPEPYVEVGSGQQLNKRQHNPDQFVDHVFYAMDPPRDAPADTDVPSGEDQQMLMYQQMRSEFRAIPYNAAPRPPKRALPQRFFQRPAMPQPVEVVPTEDGIEIHPVEVEPEVEETLPEPTEPEGPGIKIKVQDNNSRLEKRKFDINANVPPCEYPKDNLSLQEHKKCPNFCSNKLLPCRKHCVSPYIQQHRNGHPRAFPDAGVHHEHEDPMNFSPPRDYKKTSAPAPIYESDGGEVRFSAELPQRKSLGSVGNLSPKGTPKYSDASQPALPVWNKPLEKANRRPQGFPNWNPPMDKANRKPQAFPNWNPSRKEIASGDSDGTKVISELPDGFKHLSVPGSSVVLYKMPTEEGPKTVSLVPKALAAETSTLLAVPKSLTLHTSTLLSVPDSLTFTKVLPTTSVSTSTSVSVATMTSVIPARQVLVEVPVPLESTMTAVSLATATTEIPARLALVEVPVPSNSTVVHAVSWTTSIIPFTTSTHIPAVVGFVEHLATVAPSLTTSTVEATLPPVLVASLAPTTTTKSLVETLTPVLVAALPPTTSTTSLIATLTPTTRTSWSTLIDTYTQTTSIPAVMGLKKYPASPMGISEALLADIAFKAPAIVTLPTRTLRPRYEFTSAESHARLNDWGRDRQDSHQMSDPYSDRWPQEEGRPRRKRNVYTPLSKRRPAAHKINKKEVGSKESI